MRCNSLEEISALREAHAEFQKSLLAAEEDFKHLQQLDRQIKSFNVGPNPYTWFTMDALEETWRNLQKIIKVAAIKALQLASGRFSYLRGHLYHTSCQGCERQTDSACRFQDSA